MENLVTLDNLDKELLLDLSDDKSIKVKDFDEIKNKVLEELKSYNYVVTNSDYEKAKSDKAFLNKVSKNVDALRIKTEKDYLTLIAPFKEQCKDLKEIIDKASNELSAGVKAIDDTFKTEKYNELKEYYDRGNSFKFLTFDDILVSTWLTKSMKIEDAKKSIDDLLLNINLSVSVLKSNFADKEELKLVMYIYFFKCERNINKALDYYVELTGKLDLFDDLVK